MANSKPITRWWHDNVFDAGLLSDGRPSEATLAQRDALANLNQLGGNDLGNAFQGDALTEEEWQAQQAARQAAAANAQAARSGRTQSLYDQLGSLSYDQWIQQVTQSNDATPQWQNEIQRIVPREQYEAAQAQGGEALQQLIQGSAEAASGGQPSALANALRSTVNVGGPVQGAGTRRLGNAQSYLGESYDDYLNRYRQEQFDAGLELQDPTLQTLMQRPDMADAAADPYAIESQRAALSGMRDIYDQGGYTESERAQLRLSQQDSANFGQSQLEGQLQQLSARGLTGSGIEAMMRGASSQSAANSAARSADQIAIEGQRRALQALDASGAMASSQRAQSFSEDAARRAAIDYVNQANTQYQQGVQQRNVDRRYTAAGAQMNQANLGVQQDMQGRAMNAAQTAGLANLALGIYTGLKSNGAPANGTGGGAADPIKEEDQY